MYTLIFMSQAQKDAKKLASKGLKNKTLAILAGRKYNTAGFQLLSPTTIMNIESLRDDPTAKQLIELLFPDKLAAARSEGKTEGITEATKNFIRRFSNTLSEEQIKQLKDETG